ncbi:MAG: hypothetical protein II889_04415 [Clostridia bacterium]|nr:hypothetical protein [Clostridia bacterium]
MKRHIGRAAVLLALLTAVTGCGIPHIRRIEPVTVPERPETEASETETPETEIPETEIPETEAPETEPPETEIPETEIPETEAPETEPPEPALPDNVRVYAEEEFYTPLTEDVRAICLPFMPETVSNIENGYVLVGSTWEDPLCADLALVDLETRTVTVGRYDFEYGDEEDYYGYGFLLFLMDGRPVIFDCGRHALCALDETLCTGTLTPLPDDSIYGATLLAPDRLAFSGGLTGFRDAVLAEDGTFSFHALPVSLPDRCDEIDISAALSDDLLLVSCYSSETYDSCCGVYSLTDGSVTLFNGPGYNLSVCGGYLIESDYTKAEVRLYDPARPEACLSIAVPEACYLSWPDPDSSHLYFLNDTEDHISIFRFDPDSGLRVDAVSLPVPEDSYAYVYGVRDWNGDAYFFYEREGVSSFCRWEADEEGDGRIGFDLLERDGGEQENQALIEALYEEYGVTVYTGTDAVRYMVGYAVLPETDESLIHRALEELGAFFAHLPEGFMKEVVSYYSSLDICLTGRIIPERDNRNSISDATAFTTETNGIELAVFDINQSGIDKTVAHEFMHVFENTVYHIGWERDLEEFSRWSMFNPDDFEYRYVYTDEDGNTYNWDDNGLNGQYWEEGSDPDGIYFVDGYSMTYPTEDMARIFENLATAWKYDLPGYFAGEPIQRKAAYLAACLREAFSSIGDETVCVWEETLNPDYTLDYFRENYDLEAWLEEHAVG